MDSSFYARSGGYLVYPGNERVNNYFADDDFPLGNLVIITDYRYLESTTQDRYIRPLQ